MLILPNNKTAILNDENQFGEFADLGRKTLQSIVHLTGDHVHRLDLHPSCTSVNDFILAHRRIESCFRYYLAMLGIGPRYRLGHLSHRMHPVKIFPMSFHTV